MKSVIIAHAIADAPTMDAVRRPTAFPSSVVGPEIDYFERAFDALVVGYVVVALKGVSA